MGKLIRGNCVLFWNNKIIELAPRSDLLGVCAGVCALYPPPKNSRCCPVVAVPSLFHRRDLHRHDSGESGQPPLPSDEGFWTGSMLRREGARVRGPGWARSGESSSVFPTSTCFASRFACNVKENRVNGPTKIAAVRRHSLVFGCIWGSHTLPNDWIVTGSCVTHTIVQHVPDV